MARRPVIRARIVCVGNSLVAGDAIGIHVLEELRTRSLDADVHLVEGRLGGLDLLPCFEGCGRVVLVDRVVGFGRPGEVVRLEAGDLGAFGTSPELHSGGLLYLLKALPFLGIKPLPDIYLIGIEGEGDEAAVRLAADRALEAVNEIP